jgi:hypothetical protein
MTARKGAEAHTFNLDSNSFVHIAVVQANEGRKMLGAFISSDQRNKKFIYVPNYVELYFHLSYPAQVQ